MKTPTWRIFITNDYCYNQKTVSKKSQKNAKKIINTYKGELKSELHVKVNIEFEEQTLCIYISVETHSIHWFHIMMIQRNKTIDNTHWVETNEESWHVCVVLSVHWVASSLNKVDEMRNKFVSVVQSFFSNFYHPFRENKTLLVNWKTIVCIYTAIKLLILMQNQTVRLHFH